MMAKMKKFMVVHRDPAISWNRVEANWAKMARVESAEWIRTCFNKKQGARFCVWLAPSEAHLKEIFNNMDVRWESILEVEETVPDLWGAKWAEHLKAEESADTRAF
jgi:hypothetical protein